MRVTNGMIVNTSLNGLYNNMNRLNKTYAQMTTGKKIQTVSDDPIIAGRSLKLKTTVLETTQYESNTKEAMSWMEVSEAALSNITEILKEIRTKCVQGANGTLEKEDLEVIETEIQQLWEQIQEEANTTYGDRYVFSGFKTDQPLFKDGILNQNLSNTNNDKIEYEIGVKSTIDVNVYGMYDLVEKMDNFINGLKGGTADDFTNAIKEIDEKLLADISQKTSDLGSRMSRVEYTQQRLVDHKTTFKNLLSNTEDVDIEETYTNFTIEYSAYQSALQATSKIITNTLADYL